MLNKIGYKKNIDKCSDDCEMFLVKHKSKLYYGSLTNSSN